MQLKDGSKVSKYALSEEKIDAIQDALTFTASWNWTHLKKVTGRPEAFLKFSTKNFRLYAPAAWRNRAIVYLGHLERSRNACVAMTESKGPKLTEIYWRLNTHSSNAGKGEDNPFMSMPFDGLRQDSSPYEMPWFTERMMLLTFGYQHGERMDQLSEECLQMFVQSPWLPVDQDDLMPEFVFTPSEDDWKYKL